MADPLTSPDRDAAEEVDQFFERIKVVFVAAEDPGIVRILPLVLD